eukprot:7863828-Heterocapsa_arctica.AAC.1
MITNQLGPQSLVFFAIQDLGAKSIYGSAGILFHNGLQSLHDAKTVQYVILALPSHGLKQDVLCRSFKHGTLRYDRIAIRLTTCIPRGPTLHIDKQQICEKEI